jgi:hypothetical protein
MLITKALCWLGLCAVASALGQEKIISTDGRKAELQIAGDKIGRGQILVSSNDYWGVIRAAGDLAVDFGRVTGVNYTLSNGEKGAKPAEYVYHPVNNKNNTHVSLFGAVYTASPLNSGLTFAAVLYHRHGAVLRPGLLGPGARQDRHHRRHHRPFYRHRQADFVACARRVGRQGQVGGLHQPGGQEPGARVRQGARHRRRRPPRNHLRHLRRERADRREPVVLLGRQSAEEGQESLCHQGQEGSELAVGQVPGFLPQR